MNDPRRILDPSRLLIRCHGEMRLCDGCDDLIHLNQGDLCDCCLHEEAYEEAMNAEYAESYYKTHPLYCPCCGNSLPCHHCGVSEDGYEY